MNAARQLAYNYLKLPWHIQIRIAEKLKLLPKNWRQLKNEALDKAIFIKARQTNKFEELKSEIFKIYH